MQRAVAGSNPSGPVCEFLCGQPSSPPNEENDMKKMHLIVATSIVAVAALGVAPLLRPTATGATSTNISPVTKRHPRCRRPGAARSGWVDKSKQEIRYRLSFSGLESSVTQAHIHFENRTNAATSSCSCARTSATGRSAHKPARRAAGSISGTIRRPTSAPARPRRESRPVSSRSSSARSRRSDVRQRAQHRPPGRRDPGAARRKATEPSRQVLHPRFGWSTGRSVSEYAPRARARCVW